MEVVHVQIAFRGTSPLLMHNERLANPFDDITKQIKVITAKRTRQTEQDKLDIMFLEWQGGLYQNSLGPYIPAANVKKCVMEAAAISRAATAVKRALVPLDTEIPLVYDGPRTVEGLWEAGFRDVRSVRLNGKTKVLRTRPCFAQWELATTMMLDINIVSVEDLTRFVVQAGTTTGLGDYRPTMGRFIGAVQEVKV